MFCDKVIFVPLIPPQKNVPYRNHWIYDDDDDDDDDNIYVLYKWMYFFTFDRDCKFIVK